MDSTYPVELNLKGRLVVVVGGGEVAARKVDGLLDAGARVRVVSPDLHETLHGRAGIEWWQHAYQPHVLDGACLVFACTDDSQVNAQIAMDARSGGAWCNVADDPAACDFVVPATMRHGPFVVAVGTGGASPGLSARARDDLKSNFGPEFGILAEELARVRHIVKQRVADTERRRALLDRLCTDCSLKLIAGQGREAWRVWFEKLLRQATEETGKADKPT